jgi:acyl-CoA reductase-like NAD-dependent aldehyde dehydrogenase
MMNGPIDMSGERVNMPPTDGLQVIPDAAVEAAAKAFIATRSADHYTSPAEYAAAMLEAAAPILLSHEREETRLAHLDAVVNAGAVDELSKAVERVEALHRPRVVYAIDPKNGTWIYDGDERRILATICGECSPEFIRIEDDEYDELDSDGDVHWPCPTIAAITEGRDE